jgi:hypothetical protein
MPFSAMTKYECGNGLGVLVIPCPRSTCLRSMCVATTDVVPMTNATRDASIAPHPIADVIESTVAGITGVPGATPRCAAASADTAPSGSSAATIGATTERSRPHSDSSSSSWSTFAQSRLSVHISGNAVLGVDVTRPVSRAVSASAGST